MMTPEDKVIHEKAVLISQHFKKIEIELLDILQKVMDRKIFLSLGFSSMYEYAISLGLSEANAYTYTKIVKVSVRIPELKTEIEKGSVSITNARRIAPVLTSENKAELLQKASSLSSRSLEKVVAALQPESIRESVRAVSEDRLSLKLGRSEVLLQRLKRAQVFQRDQGKCVFQRPDGSRCGSEHFVEIHHRIPFSHGGLHTIQNLLTLCASHHRHHHDRQAVG